MHADTELLHAGYLPVAAPGPFAIGPQFSATYVAPGDPAGHAHTYGRVTNPTWTALEDAIATLEGGEAVAFASGMAATAAVLGSCLKPGDVAVFPTDSYFTTRMVASDWLRQIGVEVRSAPTRDNAQQSLLDGATLLWIETPTNPRLDVCDVPALVAAARERDVTVAIDNTTATAYLQKPLAMGVDYVVMSDTKAMTGHSDLILGHVATADPARAEELRQWRTRHGAIPGPMEAWLAHRSLATLPLRLTRQCASAQRVAEFLADALGAQAAHYPGLASHADHALAARQMTAFGGLVSFELPTAPKAQAFLAALTLVREATSFSGLHSTAERRARWGGDDVGEGFIRFSVGCEAVEDILHDLQRGLAAAR